MADTDDLLLREIIDKKGKPTKTLEGCGYLINDPRAELAYTLFFTDVDKGAPGLCFSRMHPNRIFENYGYKNNITYYWLTYVICDNGLNPTNLGILTRIITDYITKYKNGVILIDGIEYLILNNEFHQVLRVIEHVNDYLMQTKAKMYIPVNPDAFDQKEFAFLTRNLEVISNITL